MVRGPVHRRTLATLTKRVIRQSPQMIDSPSFALCIEAGGKEDCGSSVYPSVAKLQSTSQDTYSMSMFVHLLLHPETVTEFNSTLTSLVPNITSQGYFVIKMESDGGDSYLSPDFALVRELLTVLLALSFSLCIRYIAANASAIVSSAYPSITPDPNASMSHAPTNKTNAVAIGVPTAMVGIALLGALWFFISKRRREEREAGGSSTSLRLAPTIVPPTSAPQSASTEKVKSLDPGEASFFSISLNKTRSEMTDVEKAVCGIIGDTGLVPDQTHAIKLESARAITDGRRSRMRLVDDDESSTYTMPPPARSWQGHRVRERDRGRSGERTRSSTPVAISSEERARVHERQLRRAEEREYDRLWEMERRERAKEMLSRPPPAFHDPGGYDSRAGSSSMGRSVRSAPEYHPYDEERLHERHSLPQYDDWSDYRRRTAPPDYLPHDRERESDRPTSRTSYSRDPYQANPSSAPRSLTAQYIPRANSQPEHGDYSRYSSRAPSRTAMRRPMSHDPDPHATYSVLSPYFAPSPYAPSPAIGFPASPYIPPRGPSGAEHPLSLQAGRPGMSSMGPLRPPGLEHSMTDPRPPTRAQGRSYAGYPDEFDRRLVDMRARAGHPRFAFEERQASQFRFSRMGDAQYHNSWPSERTSQSQSRMGDYVERPLARYP